MIPIHKSLLAMFLDKVDDKEISNIARLFAEVKVKDMTLILRNNYNLVSFLDVLESWMKVSSVSFSKRMIDNAHLYTISHEVGSKWSAFLSIMLQEVFMKMGIADVSFEFTDNTILFGIPTVKVRSK